MLGSEACQFLRYWCSLGGGRIIPDRSNLELRKLTSLLPWMFILEMGPDGSLRYRLVGSAIEEAMGRGMTGQAYADKFRDPEQAAMLEELYSMALVQSCGLIRSGSFYVDGDCSTQMETLVLPFSEARAMGGVVLVGYMKPFDCYNQSFSDKWGSCGMDISDILVIPAPRILDLNQLSAKAQRLLRDHDVHIEALDVHRVLEMDAATGIDRETIKSPTLSLEKISTDQIRQLN